MADVGGLQNIFGGIFRNPFCLFLILILLALCFGGGIC